MSEIKIDSGTPAFDELVRKRYQEFPALERQISELRDEIERLKGEYEPLVEHMTAWIDRRKNKIHPTDPIHETLQRAKNLLEGGR